MKIINSSNRTLKLVSLVLIALLILSAVSISITAIVIGHNNGIDLDTVSYREVENVATIINANSQGNNSNGISAAAGIDAPSGTAEERYLTLYDFDNTKKYLYIEYIGEGFAIYDRLGEYIYEKSELGNGPFDEFSENDKIYYGGPSYYYVAENGGYRHVVTGAVIGAADAKGFSDGLQEIRAKYQDNQLSELSLRSATTLAAEQHFIIGQNNENEVFRNRAAAYFASKVDGERNNFQSSDSPQIWRLSSAAVKFYDNYEDVYCAINKYGSCGYVALATMINFYQRMGIIMVANQENWHMMYNIEIKAGFKAPFINKLKFDTSEKVFKGHLSDLSNRYFLSERIHQELLYQQYPNLRGATYFSSNAFRSNTYDVKSAYEKYCKANGVTNYGYIIDLNTYKLPEKIVNGNLCLVTLKSGEPNLPPNSSHAAVAYAFNGTKPWWYSVSSVVCDYGWDRESAGNPIFAEISVNPNFIVSNDCIDVYRY